MQNPIDGSGGFSLDRAAEHLNRITAENDIDALLARAQKNTEQTAQNAAVEAAQRAAEKATAMAQGAIGEIVQNAAEVPVATQATEDTPAATYVSERTYQKNLESVPGLNTITPEEAAIQLFTEGLALRRARESSAITTANNPSEFGLAA